MCREVQAQRHRTTEVQYEHVLRIRISHQGRDLLGRAQWIDNPRPSTSRLGRYAQDERDARMPPIILRLAQLADSPRPSTSRLGRYAQEERGSRRPPIILRLAQLADRPRPSTSCLGRYAQGERSSRLPLIMLRLAQLADRPRPSTSRLVRYAQGERDSRMPPIMPLILSVGREEAEVEGRPVSRQPFTPGSIGRRARRSADPCVTAFVQQARMGGITATHAPALAHRAPPRHVTPRHARPSRTRRPGRCPDVGPGPPSRRRCPPPASTKLLCQHGAQCDAVRTRLAPCRATAKV